MKSSHLTLLALLLAGAAIGCEGASRAAAESESQPAALSAPPAPAAAACGRKGQPDCPLQSWMKATLQTYQREGNYERLARDLDELAQHAPAGYAGWAEVAGSGAEAARAEDAAAVRASCKSCHDDHRARYRAERRAVAFP